MTKGVFAYFPDCRWQVQVSVPDCQGGSPADQTSPSPDSIIFAGSIISGTQICAKLHI
jgi:hypothetical protein